MHVDIDLLRIKDAHERRATVHTMRLRRWAADYSDKWFASEKGIFNAYYIYRAGTSGRRARTRTAPLHMPPAHV